MKLFDIFSPEASFMCCRGILGREPKKPVLWKPIFLECSNCHRSRTPCSIALGKSPSLVIWLCIPCTKAQPSLCDIIEGNSVKRDASTPIPYFPYEFFSKEKS